MNHAGRKPSPCWVNGVKHRDIKDAAITCGGTAAGVRQAIYIGLAYKGFRVSREPDEPVNVHHERVGGALLRSPRTNRNE
jgi:hypothetical protein